MFERLKDGSPVLKLNPIASNEMPDGNVLYTKIHGIKAMIGAGEVHDFQFQIPYGVVFFQGAEIFEDIIGVSDFTIKHPVNGAIIEQYGFSVNMGVIKYQREAAYAAMIPGGLVLSCAVKNDTDSIKEMGVNFLLHEIRSPE